MMNAITHGHKEVIKVFFNFDYCVDTVVKRGKMLLEWAIENGHLSLIEVVIPLLLQLHSFKLRTIHCMYSSLMLILQAMTDHDPNSVMEATYNENNVIHYVCKLGNACILQVCIELATWVKQSKGKLACKTTYLVTEPAKAGHICTNCTCSENSTFLGFCL